MDWPSSYKYACTLRDAWYHQAPKQLRTNARRPGSPSRAPLTESEVQAEKELKDWLIEELLAGRQVAIGSFLSGTLMRIPDHFFDERYIDWEEATIRAQRRYYNDVRVIAYQSSEKQTVAPQSTLKSAKQKLSRRPSLYNYARVIMLELIGQDKNWLETPTRYQIEEFNDRLTERFGKSSPPAYRVEVRTLHNYKMELRKELE